MSYHERDWYKKSPAQPTPPNDYREALAAAHRQASASPQGSQEQPPPGEPGVRSKWHGPSVLLGAFIAFALIFTINGFRLFFF